MPRLLCQVLGILTDTPIGSSSAILLTSSPGLCVIFLNELWCFVSFKKLAHFIDCVKLCHFTLFVTLSYTFHICRSCCGIISQISETGTLSFSSFFFLLISLRSWSILQLLKILLLVAFIFALILLYFYFCPSFCFYFDLCISFLC